MEEPPAKRARRADSTAMWERNETSATSSPRPHDDRESRNKGSERSNKRRESDHKRRSGSRERKDRKQDRSRSTGRSDRDRDKNRDRDRARDVGRDRGREAPVRREHDRSRSRDPHHGSKEYAPSRADNTRRRSRSRSPVRNTKGPATRTRSPLRGLRTERDRPPPREHRNDADKYAQSSNPIKSTYEPVENAYKVVTNGHKEGPSDEDDEDTLLRKMMGFSTFKSTQNTKVPGNNIYGVRKEKKTEYRQYMNRVGGFNRPLSPTR